MNVQHARNVKARCMKKRRLVLEERAPGSPGGEDGSERSGGRFKAEAAPREVAATPPRGGGHKEEASRCGDYCPEGVWADLHVGREL